LNKSFPSTCHGFHDEPGQIAIQNSAEGFTHSLSEVSETTPIIAAFTGHDHGTGWCCPGLKGSHLEGIQFCFGKHSGYGGYGDWERGARVIELKFN
ncbi:purple acid phosphatase, partial [Blyttiomyces sp. JEL0837]